MSKPIRSPLVRELASVSATEAKNEFGQVLEKVIRGGTVVITRHNPPRRS